MSSGTKTLSLLEQKRIQWAKEREEMVGLCGLWGHSKYRGTQQEDEKFEDFHLRKSVLPPIPARGEAEEKGPGGNCRPEEESETSGYLSDSPKHSNEADGMRYKEGTVGGDWEKREGYATDETGDGRHAAYGMDRKSYKNYRNERWARQSSDSWHQPRQTKGWWFGTPESASSDDGSRLRWGDRGVGIGHLWEPVVHQPDSRLPQVESYRPTPKWVERGLRQGDGSQKADILIIHHPDEEQYKNYSSDSQTPKNFLLGQNVRLTPDVIEERERKRRRALEHQNAIRQQLEDRERKRKEERLNKLREERLEEERIKREQEAERLRMEDEQRRNKEKEEKEKRKEQAMREAIELAERRAREEKRQQRKYIHLEEGQPERERPTPESGRETKRTARTPKTKNPDEGGRPPRSEKVASERQSTRTKTRKDSSSQFEQVRIPNGVQFLNMNNLPMDGSLALVLDNQPPESSFLLPPDSVQLALLMSPGNVTSSQIIPLQTPAASAPTPRTRVLTPSKFRESSQRDKTTQTDGTCCSASSKPARGAPRARKQSRRSGRGSGGSDSSDKSNSLERPRGHFHAATSSKHRSRSQPRHSIDDRPKWGINRPSVQYKKQSEKDIYYQKRIRQRLKKVNDASTSTETTPKAKDGAGGGGEEKLLESEMRLLKCDSEEDETEPKKPAEDFVLRNGYRMNSNPSSPLFVPIDSDRSGKTDDGQEFVLELTIEPEVMEKKEEEGTSAEVEGFEDTAVPGSVGFVTQAQLEAIRQIASIREGLQRLQMDFSSSRSITPHSDNKKKEPTQVLDLSKVKIGSKEDFKKYLDRVPEFKIKPEKVLLESIRVRDKDFTFAPGKREEKQTREWSFPDPTPPDMRSVKLEDLCPVNIDWKMLTTLRPKTKVEEEMFSRLVQLGKLDLKYQQALRREKAADWVRRTKNPRSSIVEVRVLSCKDCGEDFCDGSLCSKLTYDNFSRSQASTSGEGMKSFKLPEPGKSSKKKKGKRKSRRRRRSSLPRRVKPRKNSIFNRPATRGCSRDHARRSKAAESLRSSSLNRIQAERKPTLVKLGRSKSAPRLRMKRETSDPAFAPRSEYASDSAPTQTDYSSQSDTDSSPEGARRRRSTSPRVGFVEGRTRSPESDTPGPSSRRHPTTIQIKFDGFHPSSVFFPRRSYVPASFGAAAHPRRSDPVPRNQEVTRIVEGFARIDLSFADDEPCPRAEVPAMSPRRISSRVSRCRARSHRELFPSSSYVRGLGLLTKANLPRE